MYGRRPGNSGRLYYGNVLSRLPIVGGNWNNAANAGVFYLNLNNPRSNSNHNIGFRSALLSYARTGQIKVCPAVREIKGGHFRSGQKCRRKILTVGYILETGGGRNTQKPQVPTGKAAT